MMQQGLDVVVIGAGQAGLATGYFLRRTNLSFVLLDAEEGPGGAWRHGWTSLRLFSPAQWSSLPGWPMPRAADGYPTRAEVVADLGGYERRYELPVRRPVRVDAVTREQGGLQVHTSTGILPAEAVVSATGTWSAPYVPDYPGRTRFVGTQLHSAHYEGPAPYTGKRVLWCTGFRPALSHLQRLDVVAPDGRVATDGTRATACPGLWLVGYGEWTGFASATLVGIMRSARATAEEILRFTQAGPTATSS